MNFDRVKRLALNAGALKAQTPDPTPRTCGVFFEDDALARFARTIAIDRTRRLELRIEDLETELAAKGGAA